MENFNMKKFRSIRQLISSVACIVLSIIVVRMEYPPNERLLLQILLMVLGVGVFYCIFALANLVTKITRDGFIRKKVVPNCVLDTIVYLALCAGGFFLVTFIFNTIPWLALLFVLGGFFECGRDIQYLVERGSMPDGVANEFEQCNSRLFDTGE